MKECRLNAGFCARPLPFMFPLNPHLWQETKELTLWRQRCQGPEQFAAWPGTWLNWDADSKGTSEARSATRRVWTGGKMPLIHMAKEVSILSPTSMFLVQDQPLTVGQWSPLVWCDYHIAVAMNCFPTTNISFQGFNWRSSSSLKSTENYITLINK